MKNVRLPGTPMVPATKRSGGSKTKRRRVIWMTVPARPDWHRCGERAMAGARSTRNGDLDRVVAAGAVRWRRRPVGRLDGAGPVGRPDLDRVRSRPGGGRIPGDEP